MKHRENPVNALLIAAVIFGAMTVAGSVADMERLIEAGSIGSLMSAVSILIISSVNRRARALNAQMTSR